jgi:hypothetical protein
MIYLFLAPGRYGTQMAENELVDFESLPDNVKRLIEVTYRSGYVRPQVTLRIGDVRFVAVGSRLLSGRWVTFPDFLTDYCKTVLGAAWGNAEIVKPFEQKHPIMQWYQKWAEFSSNQSPASDGTFMAVASGPVSAWFHLAYDLYVLQHNAILQSALVDRIRKVDQFQGARYELTVAASFIRAGFKIKHEDETDRQRKHPEFIATYESTGETIAVEAKSRHRPGVLGRPGQMEQPADVTAGIASLLQSALDKAIEQPYVVCIDLNLPPFGEGNVLQQPQIREVMETIVQKEKNYPKEAFPITVVVVTNFPHYYVSNDVEDPRKDFLVSPSTYPKYPIGTAGIVDVLFKSLNEYAYIPNYFMDSK